MKYAALDIRLSPSQRAESNHRIVNLILSGNTRELTPQDVHSQFTGKGALHGLDFSDFDSRYAYSEAKKEFELGQFFTPDSLCAELINALRPHYSLKIGDLTCGKGSFFNYLPTEKNIYGNELDEDAYEVCRFLYPDANIDKGDFLEYEPDAKLDMIVGNPPFNIRTDQGTSQFAFVKKSYKLLNNGGILAFIVPISFLADDLQDGHKIKWLNENFNFICQCRLPADTFDAKIQTKVIFLQKKGVTNSKELYSPHSWETFDPNSIYQKHIEHLMEQYFRDRYKNKMLAAQEGEPTGDNDYKLKRRLWHIKENKRLHEKYYKRVKAKINLLATQKQPEGMNDEKWEQVKMTPKKILHYAESIVRNQNAKPPRRVVKLVKCQYGVKLKAYHPRLKKEETFTSIHDILEKGGDYKQFNRLFDRKRKALQVQNRFYTDLGRSSDIDKFLDSVSLVPPIQPGLLFQRDDVPTIRPNDMQKADLGLILQKHYSILSWEQGGGKSVAGMIWIKYWQPYIKHCFVLGPAVAITGTWAERLENYGFDFLVLKSIRDLDKIGKGQIVLVSYDKLIELKRHLKRFIRRCSHKIGLIVDESDELTNPTSERSLAALNCFRKGKVKLLTTGTTTRNTINEIYTQLELIYNNSTAFMCMAPYAYYVDKEGELQMYRNDEYGLPFPARSGNALFKACFCPVKSTVFGIKKENQDVYNADVLKEIINKSVVTRKFEEIVGEKKYSIHVHHVTQKFAEKSLYSVLMNEFMRVCYDYYQSTGNFRKEAGLRLLRQMNVLIMATSRPHKMKNYPGTDLPAKFDAIGNLVAGWPNEIVTIGTTTKETADLYLFYLASKFPNRKLHYIDGTISVSARKKILLQLKASRNGILVATQQSLKSSLNIPFCNKCIIESLQWNIPKISQFYFRFIRFDSTRHTEVHFVNYLGTIEINLMALLMSKEKLNDFIKTTNETTTAKIYEEFGFDVNILDMLIEKTYDGDGKLVLRWGDQTMAAA